MLMTLRLLACAACRWLVSDRKDGANVNGWHWEERNMMGWSRDKLTELLVGLVADISPAQGAAEVTELKDLKGEVNLWASCVQTALLRLRKGMYDILSAPAACTAPELPAELALAYCPAAHLTQLQDIARRGAHVGAGYC